MLLVLAALALCVAGFVRSVYRSKARFPPTAGVSTVGDDFEEFVKQRQAVMLSRAAEPRPAQAPAASASHPGVNLGDGVGFELGIVGESHYMSALRKIARRHNVAGKPAEFLATLRPEPDNPYDPNAVAVLDDLGEKIGYLSREDAVTYRAVLQAVTVQGAVATCRAMWAGGTPAKPNHRCLAGHRSAKDAAGSTCGSRFGSAVLTRRTYQVRIKRRRGKWRARPELNRRPPA